MASRSGVKLAASHFGVKPRTVRNWLVEFNMSAMPESAMSEKTISLHDQSDASSTDVGRLQDQGPIIGGHPLEYVHVSDSTDIKFGDTRYEARPSTGGSYLIVKYGAKSTGKRQDDSQRGWELYVPDIKHKHRDYEGTYGTQREAMIAGHRHWAVANAPTPDPQYADPMDDPAYSDWMAHNYPAVPAASDA